PATDASPRSLHDALPICSEALGAETVEMEGPLNSKVNAPSSPCGVVKRRTSEPPPCGEPIESLEHAAIATTARAVRIQRTGIIADRKSTRLNSSHVSISY